MDKLKHITNTIPVKSNQDNTFDIVRKFHMPIGLN